MSRFIKSIKLFLFFLIVLALGTNITIFNNSDYWLAPRLIADTLTTSLKITPKHTLLKAVNYYIYLLPPDNTFSIFPDNQDFGIESKKYNASITMKFQGAEPFSYADSIFRKAIRYYKQDTSDYYFYKSNNILVKYVKYESLVGNDTIINWNAICGNELFALVIHTNYPIKHDKKLGKLVENTMRNIIITENPNIKPEENVLMDFDYSILNLKFFQKYTLSFTIFSEDGLPPPKISKSSKFVIFSSLFTTSNQKDNLAEQVIDLINNSFVEYIPSQIQVTKISETEIHQQKGIEFEGVFENNEDLHFLAFMASTKNTYHIIFAFAPEKEKNDLFKKVREMLKTVILY